MGETKRFVLSNIGGGINQGDDPTDIEDNEMSALQNWYPWAKRLIRRAGATAVSDAAGYFENVTNAFPYKTATGVWTLLVGGLTSLGKMSGSALVVLPQLSSAYTSRTEPWSFAQYIDIVYAARRDSFGLQRVDGAIVSDAGISAPSTGPTMTQGAVGNLDAGDYIGVVTFYNSATAAESNPSPNSSTLTLAASKKIDWSAIEVSTNFQVTSRRLYRTLVDQQGVYYFVGVINDNSTTVFTDNVVQVDMGAQASFDYGLPPSGLRYLTVFQERMWGTDERDVFFSEIGKPEGWGEFSFLQVNPDDGHKVKGLLSLGDKLIIGKTNSTFILTGTSAASFNLQSLSDKHGVFSHHTMKASEGFAFWFGGDNFYQSDGNSVKAIGDKKIRTLVDGIDLQYADLMTSAVDAKKGWYLTLIPAGGTSTVNTAVVFNYRDSTWCTFQWSLEDVTQGSPTFLADFYTTTGKQVIYANLAGGQEDQIFQLQNGTQDDGRDIVCNLVTKYFGYDKEDIMKFMKDISIQTTIVQETMDATLLKDAAVVSDLGLKTFSLDGIHLWKRAPLANNGDPAVAMAMQLDYSGSAHIEIMGISFKIVDLERSVPMSDWA